MIFLIQGTFEENYTVISIGEASDDGIYVLFTNMDRGIEAPLLFMEIEKDCTYKTVEIPLEITGHHNLSIIDNEEGIHIGGLTDQGRDVLLGMVESPMGNRLPYTSPDYLTYVIIKDGKVVYQNQTPIEQHIETAVLPEGDNIKLIKPASSPKEFKYNKIGYGTFMSESFGDKGFLLGQDYSKGLIWVAQYDNESGLEKTYFRSRTLPTAPNQFFYPFKDKIYWFIG
ncbi:MAG: hypothetical protein AAGI38_18010 [Bacteroidota bacterium]